MKLVDLIKVTFTGLSLCTLTASGQQSLSTGSRVQTILEQLTLNEKLSYIGGTGFFDLKPVPPVAHFPGTLNPQIYETDGPLGVRRNSPSVRFPSGLTLAATWNPALSYEQGYGMGLDTRARGYFSIEGPGMDFYRVPLNGRNFEYLTGEDPYLGSQLAPAEVRGIQSRGTWASAKHLVCNDEEENRTNVHVVLDERTLREIYLPPFEASVKQGHAATVMGAYNAIRVLGLNNTLIEDNFCCENNFLLNTIVKKEWGFKGILVSDYNAIHDGVKAAQNGCDVDLPAGQFMNPTTLGPAISSGQLAVSTIDDKVSRILNGVISFGYLDRQQLLPSIPLDNPYSEYVALQIAREGIVLLKNQNALLPLGPDVRSIAVIGDYVKSAPPTGFGSSYVTPVNWVSELDGIRAIAPTSARVDYIGQCSLNPTDTIWESIDQQGEIVQGLKGEYFASNDLSGTPVTTQTDILLNFEWTTAASPNEDDVPVQEIPPAIPAANQGKFSVRWTGQIRPKISGDQVFKVRADGGLRLIVNGQTLVDTFNNPPTPPVGYGPTPALSGRINLQAGKAYPVTIEYRRFFFFNHFQQGGWQGVQASWASLQAPTNLAAYDAVVVTGGLGEEYEGEGYDRPFTLPEFQDELFQNLARVNPRTIVVLHGGGNFDSLSWINQVGAYLHTFYPGQNGGQALAEILFGEVNPSGKLPVTFERRITDNPAYATFPNPVNQHPTEIDYSEGLYVGYRGYEKHNIKPLYAFGYGLSYTTFGFSGLHVVPALDGDVSLTQVNSPGTNVRQSGGQTLIDVTFSVANTGKVAGAEVAQLYVGQENPPVDRPVKELKGFRKVYLEPGQSQVVTLPLNVRSFAYWNEATQKWTASAGTYDISVGAASDDIQLKGKFSLPTQITINP